MDRSRGSDDECSPVDINNEELENLEHHSNNDHSSDSDIEITNFEYGKTSRIKEEHPSKRFNNHDINMHEGYDIEDEAVSRKNPFKE